MYETSWLKRQWIELNIKVYTDQEFSGACLYWGSEILWSWYFLENYVVSVCRNNISGKPVVFSRLAFCLFTKCYEKHVIAVSYLK